MAFPAVMGRLLVSVMHALRALFRSRVDRAIKNAALRQQLAALRQKGRLPQFRGCDRFSRMIPRCGQVLA